MKTLRNIPDAQEVRYRAAEVRKGWSAAEKLRRAGLPPDAPLHLRQYILGRPTFEWQTAPCEVERRSQSPLHFHRAGDAKC